MKLNISRGDESFLSEGSGGAPCPFQNSPRSVPALELCKNAHCFQGSGAKKRRFCEISWERRAARTDFLSESLNRSTEWDWDRSVYELSRFATRNDDVLWSSGSLRCVECVF